MKKPFIFCFIILFLCSCSPEKEIQKNRLERILERGEIRIVTLNGPTTYYEYRDEPYGFEYELAKAFADHLGVKAHFIVKDNVSQVLQAISDDEADLAAAGLTITPERKKHFLFSLPYYEVKEQIVCRKGKPCPKNPSDLTSRLLVVPKDSSYEEALARLKIKYPKIKWQTNSELSTEELLELVWRGKIDCVVADSNIVAITRRYYPELLVCMDLGPPEKIAWMMPKDALELKAKVDDWLRNYLNTQDFEILEEKYYGFVEIFDYVDIKRFIRRIKTTLPRYLPLFQEAAKKYGFDWTLLAAMAYQESHWNPYSRSPTGVRGIMMLTLHTAREMGIKSRLDPEASIMGGARYLAKLRQRLPKEIEEPDRERFMLAAYNVGLGHILDARELAKELGKDPNRWSDVAEVLPLLSRKKYYRKLKHGYARGWEPVIYVQRIRNYQDILQQVLGLKKTAVSRHLLDLDEEIAKRQ
ncbi:membrane-bound lytic murein transglycosylase MltF [Thermodesulfatator atlanticus]|uniref:membrane-bound lytic murein transglycosylase MltF n=1 Tax=Thermodesulfatator atlanticus TaxID=501497 RepID=UPI0003B51D33|nr:membrane-bound lytic murein transglycosylase MltF [Thermodesulfatator atlanticus]